MPATVTIPAGQANVTFAIAAVADVDGTQNVVITASSSSYHSGTAAIVVLDHEPLVLTGPCATTTNSRPTITWNPVPDALRYDIWIDSLTTGVSQLLRDINVQGTSYAPPENPGIGRYRMWVRAQNVDSFSVWSPARTFSVGLAPTLAPVKTVGAPAKPQFNWTALAGAERYELWVNNTATNARVIYQANLTTTSYTRPTLL